MADLRYYRDDGTLVEGVVLDAPNRDGLAPGNWKWEPSIPGLMITRMSDDQRSVHAGHWIFVPSEQD